MRRDNYMNIVDRLSGAMNSMRGEECTIQVNEEIGETSPEVAPDWVSQMSDELKELAQNRSEKLKQWKETSIYKIPLSLKDLCKEAYQPQMVAIGPYHHGDKQLKGMEEHKKRALLNFLERSGKTLQCYVTALTPSVQKFQNAYHELQPELQTDDFLKMMIVDGCFMLELMRTSTNPELEDPIFSKHGHLYFGPYLKRDMLMLENQLPLLVLNKLADAGGLWKEQDQLTGCILEFFDRGERISDKEKFRNCSHVLDLYRKSLLLLKEAHTPPRCCRETLQGVCLLGWCCKKEKGKQYNMRSATELSEAWIRLEKSETTCLDDIRFSGRVLKLPLIKVDDATRHLYLNLMALERFHVDAGSQVTSYVFFMDKLIETAQDVSLLHWHGIMENLLGSDQEAASLFNNLSTDICLDQWSVFFRVQEEVAKYYRMPLPRCIAYAKHTYFTNPWVLLSVVAAIFLFALTIVQTVYAVLDYHKK